MESFSLKQCVFTAPEGKVEEVTQEEAAGGLKGIRFFFANKPKKCGNTGWMFANRKAVFFSSSGWDTKTSNHFCIKDRKDDRVWY